jgi:hypothetical protein
VSIRTDGSTEHVETVGIAEAARCGGVSSRRSGASDWELVISRRVEL